MRIKKYEGNPILSPHKNNSWENLAVCNPGAWYESGKFYLLYRAAGNDSDHSIHMGLAVSSNGYDFYRTSDSPVFSPSSDGPDAGCVEDARIVKFDKTFFITYAFRPFPPGEYWKFPPGEVKQYHVARFAPDFLRKNITNSGLAISEDLKNFRRLGRITVSNIDNRDVVLFPEKIDNQFFLLHRPKEWTGQDYGCDYPGIWMSCSYDLLNWRKDRLLIKGEESWEQKIGGGPPPLLTEAGWLLLYHGVDALEVYRMGVLLLDKNDPFKIIARSRNSIMEPDQEYEKKGFYNNCVFPTGNVIVDDTLFIYYGGADKYCCLATVKVDDILDYIRKQ